MDARSRFILLLASAVAVGVIAVWLQADPNPAFLDYVPGTDSESRRERLQ